MLKESGGVLLIVLTISMLIVTMAHLCISSGILQIKMVNNFKNNEVSKRRAEQDLIDLEKKLANDATILPDNVQWLQFVPDTLMYGEKNGTDFYKLSVENKEENGAVTQLESTICLRKPKPIILYLREYQNAYHYLSLYEIPHKSLKQVFSWKIPQNIRISDPVYSEKLLKVTYVLSSDHLLYGINIQGETIFTVDILQFLQGLNISEVSDPIPLLVAKDVSWHRINKTIMMGFVQTNPPVIFAMDICDPLSLAGSPKSALLWHKVLAPHVQAKNLTISKLINGWSGLSYYLENNHTHILVIDLLTGVLIKEFVINGKLTSQIVAVDPKEQGFSDVLYVGDEQGTIWKGELSDKHSENWHMKAYSGLVEGKIAGTPLVGRHPQGKGILLFVMAQEASKQQNAFAITDFQNNLSIYYRLQANELFKQQMLWQNYLLLQDENALSIFESFTGKFLQRTKIQYTKSAVQEDESMQVLVDKPYDKEPFVVMSTSQGVGFNKAEILSNRLGRKTWQKR